MGRKNSSKTIQWEMDDGRMKEINICHGVQKCMQYYFSERVKNPLFILFPSLLAYTFTNRADARYGRNNNAVNGAIMEMVRERRALGKNKDGEDDVLDMLLSDELF